MTKVNALREIQSPSLHFGNGSQSASGAATASLSGTEVGLRPLVEELFSQVRFEKMEAV